MEGMLFMDSSALWACGIATAFMALDILTGCVSAAVGKTWQSAKMREGIGHKMLLILVMVSAWLIETLVMHVPDTGYSIPLLIPTALIIVAMEVSSILENVIKAIPSLEDTKLGEIFSNGK